MSGYALLKILMVPSASVAWAQLYQMTSPSFFAAGTILLFHSAMAAWYFAPVAVVSAGGGAAAGGLLCARSVTGASPAATTIAVRRPDTIAAHCRLVIARRLRSRRFPSATPGPLAATRRASRARRAGGGRPRGRSLSR